MREAVPAGAEAVEVPINRRRVGLMAVALAILGPVILLLFEPGSVHRLVGWMAVSCVPIALLKLRDRRPLLILERDGFRDPRNGLGSVAWTDVRRARLWGFGEAVYLCLAVSRLDDYVTRVSAWRSLALWLTLARFRDEVRVNLTLSRMAAGEVLREVSRRCEARSGRSA